jgi:protein-S-isoprenylcysteine O-methyltransferase Ste14
MSVHLRCNGEGQVMRVVEGVLAGLAAVLPIAAILLVSAAITPGGTLVWVRALWFLATYGAIAIIGNILLATLRPDNFRTRQQGVVAAKARKQPAIDAVGSVIFLVYASAWLVFIPVDVFWLHLLPAPSAQISSAGGAAAAFGLALSYVAIWENRFAAPNVQDQTRAGQHVVDTGVYALVRHPIYAGHLLVFCGAALWLGSYAALIAAAGLVLATVGRIRVEEGLLRANLPGYVDYERRVRGRVIPFIL